MTKENPSRPATSQGAPVQASPLGSFAIGAVILLGSVILLCRIFLFELFSFPSEAMRPTINTDDLRLGFKDIKFGKKLVRGDVIVFNHPNGSGMRFVKRLIGMPGDRVQMIGGRLYLNGNKVPVEQLTPETITDSAGNSLKVERFREVLDSGKSYVTYDIKNNGPFDDTAVFVVPADCYFFLGDNRDNSTDSRVDRFAQDGVGFVPHKNLVGRILGVD